MSQKTSAWDAGFRTQRIDTGATTLHVRTRLQPDRPTLMLLHGYPQTHLMWHRLVPLLGDDFGLVLPDLRGYGDSGKPPSEPDFANQSKRAMAADLVAVMDHLGLEQVDVVSHDRGARVAHRLARDHATRVNRLVLMDIVPTLTTFALTDQALATRYFHWFFLIQDHPLPENMIAPDVRTWVEGCLHRWSLNNRAAFEPWAVDAYVQAMATPDGLRASCDDYRAGASIDLDHDRDDPHRINCPTLVLWGGRGFVGQRYDVLDLWREAMGDPALLTGHPLDCGHFLPEEKPAEVAQAIRTFLT
jgi:haloacetate dehalogenase